MSRTLTDGRTELQLMAIKHWQQTGTLHRLLGQFKSVTNTHPRLASSMTYFTAIVELEVIYLNRDYEAAKQLYLDSHPVEEAKYNSQRDSNMRAKRNRKGIGKSNETN